MQFSGIYSSPFCVGCALILLANEEGHMLGCPQITLADGVNLGVWEGPGTWQMAPGILGFYGRTSGKQL